MKLMLESVASRERNTSGLSPRDSWWMPGTADLDRKKKADVVVWAVFFETGSHSHYQLLVDFQVSDHSTEFLKG